MKDEVEQARGVIVPWLRYSLLTWLSLCRDDTEMVRNSGAAEKGGETEGDGDTGKLAPTLFLTLPLAKPVG